MSLTPDDQDRTLQAIRAIWAEACEGDVASHFVFELFAKLGMAEPEAVDPATDEDGLDERLFLVPPFAPAE